jgi:hypothetical protein
MSAFRRSHVNFTRAAGRGTRPQKTLRLKSSIRSRVVKRI